MLKLTAWMRNLAARGEKRGSIGDDRITPD